MEVQLLDGYGYWETSGWTLNLATAILRATLTLYCLPGYATIEFPYWRLVMQVFKELPFYLLKFKAKTFHELKRLILHRKVTATKMKSCKEIPSDITILSTHLLLPRFSILLPTHHVVLHRLLQYAQNPIKKARLNQSRQRILLRLLKYCTKE